MMKGRKLLALALTLALVLGLAVPALAETVQDHTSFEDLKEEKWSWAWETTDDAIRRGLFVGYGKDAEGKEYFGPGDPITEATGLTLCARVMTDADLRRTILNDRSKEVRELIPDNYDWFRSGAATCLEMGIVTAKDLERIRDGGRLASPMTKADFAKYLVWAMGLDDFAQGLNADELPFDDADKIQREYRPYVKLLYDWGVVRGDEKNNFNPDSDMSRAVCATMLSRAMENIVEGRGVAVELPRYTSYDWKTGYIQEVTVGDDGQRTLKLKSDITGTFELALDADVEIFQYNKTARASDLKTGVFAKLCYNTAGKVTAIRLTPQGLLTTVEGTCSAVNTESVTVDGVTYAIDRFTEVSAGGKKGDRSVIDLDSGYTDARLVTNTHGVALTLELSGGTRLTEGVLTDVTIQNAGTTQRTTISVNGMSGLASTYTLNAAVTVTVNGQPVEGMKESFEDSHVTLRVSDEDMSQLKSVDVDLDSRYIQGVLELSDAKANPQKAEIKLLGSTTRRTPYELDPECVVTYEGANSTLGSVPVGAFVTARVDGGTITVLSAWLGLEDTAGTLSNIRYGTDNIDLEVTQDNGTVMKFSVPVADLSNVAITTKGGNADITNLKTGDQVVVTVRYHNVTQIDFEPQAANVSGTVVSVTQTVDGTQFDLRLSDGTVVTYTAAANVTVTRSGTPVNISELRPGAEVALVAEGTKAASIELGGTVTSQNSVEGVIISKDDKERIATVRVAQGGETTLVKVHIPAGAKILDVTTNTELTNISRLSAGDTIQAWGSYGTDGLFKAGSVIRK